MQLGDSVLIGASRERVWDFLLDAERVAGCFPELDRVERIDGTRIRSSLPVRLAFLTVRVVIDVELVEQQAPVRALFRVHATGPGATADGSAAFTLEEASEAGAGPVTVIDWTADVQPRGMIAAVGPQTVEREAAPVLQRAIDCLRRSLEG